MLIKGGIAAGGAIAGSKLAGKKSDTEKSAVSALSTAQTEGAQRGSGFLDMARDAFSPAARYYKGLLGNRSEAMSTLAPEIGGIRQGFQAARNSSQALMPRGGGRATINQQLPFQQAGQIQSLLGRARPAGAQGLMNIGQATGNQGAIMSSFGADSARSLLDYSRLRRQQEMEAGSGIGRWIWDFLQQVNIGGKKGAAPSGGSTGSLGKGGGSDSGGLGKG